MYMYTYMYTYTLAFLYSLIWAVAMKNIGTKPG